jgi:hypothetical protein
MMRFRLTFGDIGSSALPRSVAITTEQYLLGLPSRCGRTPIQRPPARRQPSVGCRHYPSPTTAEDCVASLRNAKPNIEGAGISNALRIRFTTSDYRYRNRINELYHENLSENPAATYFSKSPTPRRKTVLQRFFTRSACARRPPRLCVENPFHSRSSARTVRKDELAAGGSRRGRPG